MARKRFVSPIANPDLLPKGLRSPVSQQSQQEFEENADHDDNNNNDNSTTPTEEGEEQTETNDDQAGQVEEQNTTNDNDSEPTVVENTNVEQHSNENVMNDNDNDNNNSETGTTSTTPVESNSTPNDMERDDDNRDERSDETAATRTEEPTENQESETMNTSVDDEAVPQQEEGGIEFEDEEDDIPAKKKSKKGKKSSSKKRKRKDDDSEDEDFEQDQEESDEEEEANADEDESYDNSKEKRRQSKRASKKRKTTAEDSEGKKSKKKKKEATTAIEGAEGMLGDEEDEGYDPSEKASEGKTSKVSEQFQEILNEIKPKRHNAGQLSQIDDEAAKIADDLLFRMQQAAEDDRHNLKNQQPAMAKIQMLSEVQRTASKVYLQQPLLERGFLSVLADWLKLLPNRQLPNVNLRNVVLDILVQLPIQGDKRVMSKSQREDDDGITKDLLEKSRAIAKCVKMLSTHPKETVENKKKAKGLVERWSRLYYELPDDYSRYAPVPESDSYQRNSSSSKPKKMNARPRLSEEEEAKIKSSTRARIPQKVNFDFQRRPQNKIDMKGKNVAPPPSVGASSVTSFASPTQRRLAKKFFEMKRR